ncbi:hypothetical protein HDU92_000724 [Lobulomyces angularis]|nr:hypothetical protein HDU92_000724 [Lobulomyces angularis]
MEYNPFSDYLHWTHMASIALQLIAALIGMSTDIYCQLKLICLNLNQEFDNSTNEKLKRNLFYKRKLKALILLLVLCDFLGVSISVILNSSDYDLPYVTFNSIISSLIIFHSWSSFKLLLIYRKGVQKKERTGFTLSYDTSVQSNRSDFICKIPNASSSLYDTSMANPSTC